MSDIEKRLAELATTLADSAREGGIGAGDPRRLLNAAATLPENEARYMLLSLILDLQRRNAYLYRALWQLAYPADSVLAKVIAAHSELVASVAADGHVNWKHSAVLQNALAERMAGEQLVPVEGPGERARERRPRIVARERDLVSAFLPDAYALSKKAAVRTESESSSIDTTEAVGGFRPRTRRVTARTFGIAESRVEEGQFDFMVFSYDAATKTRHADSLNTEFRSDGLSPDFSASDLAGTMTLDTLTAEVVRRI